MSNLFSASRTASLNANAVASQPTLGAGLSAAELDAELVSALPAREEMCGSHHWCHHRYHDCDDRRYDNDDKYDYWYESSCYYGNSCYDSGIVVIVEQSY